MKTLPITELSFFKWVKLRVNAQFSDMKKPLGDHCPDFHGILVKTIYSILYFISNDLDFSCYLLVGSL
jgi:hypothetical protein